MPEIELIVFSGDGGEMARHAFGPGAYTIGRATACDVTIKTGPVSRQHARIVVDENGGVQVEDLASANGTVLDGEPVGNLVPWRSGKVLHIGEVTLQLRGGNPEFAPTLSPSQVSAEPAFPSSEITPTAEDADDLLRQNLPLETREAQSYAVGEEVARGGMGAVLQARESATRRTVAMKVMLDGSDAKATLRFIEEAQVTAQLEHPNVVPIHDLGIDPQGQPFYTMKLVAGITLKKVLELLREGIPATVEKYPLARLLTDFQKVCDALAFAHSRGVIHRDLKPANIMLGKFGEVLVMDWGLAKIVGTKGALRDDATAGASEVTVIGARREQSEVFSTMEGAIMGTPHYMSPEQAAGEIETLDARSDLFALGIILYEILTLERPFTGRTAAEILAKIGEGDFIPPAQRMNLTQRRKDAKVGNAPAESFAPSRLGVSHLPGGRVPESLDAIVRKALAPEKTARYSSVPALQADLTSYQNGFATGAERAGAWKQMKLLIKRNKAASLGAAAVLLVGSVFGTKAIIEGRRAEREAVRATAALADLKKTAPALLRLAASDADVQRYDSAFKNLDAAVALDPALTEARWRRGWVLIAQEKLPEAIAALREAAEHDPANKRGAALLPLVEKMAAVPIEQRQDYEHIRPLYDHLIHLGAIGEATPLLQYMERSTETRFGAVKERIERWLGKPGSDANATYSIGRGGGEISVTLDKLKLANIDPLHGLPIESLNIVSCGLTSLEPLRGMRLRSLSASWNEFSDLSPLEGMPLWTLFCFAAKNVTDLSPLAGIPLSDFGISDCPVSDFSALQGMKLWRLSATSTGFHDGRILAGMPLRDLDLHNDKAFSDLTGLVGLPLRYLDVRDCPVSDLSPLLKIPTLERLGTTATQRILTAIRSHPGIKLIKRGTPPTARSPSSGLNTTRSRQRGRSERGKLVAHAALRRGGGRDKRGMVGGRAMILHARAAPLSHSY